MAKATKNFMAKIKHKIARYQVALNEPQNNMLKEMMLEDAQTDFSSFFGIVLVNEFKQRQLLKLKRPQGRPRKEEDNNEPVEQWDREKEYADDLPKTIMHYGRLIGRREYDEIDNIQNIIDSK